MEDPDPVRLLRLIADILRQVSYCHPGETCRIVSETADHVAGRADELERIAALAE